MLCACIAVGGCTPVTSTAGNPEILTSPTGLPTSPSAVTSSPDGGTVAGVLEYVGGPATANQPLKRGWVEFDGPTSTRIRVDRQGRFHVALPAGVYRVTGGPQGAHYCVLKKHVVVDLGQSQEIALQCHVY